MMLIPEMLLTNRVDVTAEQYSILQLLTDQCRNWEISGKVRGILTFFTGFLFACIGHYALVWMYGSWEWRKRLVIGITGWGLAVCLIVNGFSLLF